MVKPAKDQDERMRSIRKLQAVGLDLTTIGKRMGLSRQSVARIIQINADGARDQGKATNAAAQHQA